MSWFTRKPSKEKEAAIKAVDELDRARKTRRAAFDELLSKLGEIPVDSGLTVVGKELIHQQTGSKK